MVCSTSLPLSYPLSSYFDIITKCDYMVVTPSTSPLPPYPSPLSIFQATNPDPLVDIPHMYSVMFNKQYLAEGFFVTCSSHREQIEHQTIVYGNLSIDSAFWV